MIHDILPQSWNVIRMQKHLCLSAPLKRGQVFFHDVTLFVHIIRHLVKPQRSEKHVEGTTARGGQLPVSSLIPEECTRIHQGQSQLVSTRGSVWLVPFASNAARDSLMYGRISVVLPFGNRRNLLDVGITYVRATNESVVPGCDSRIKYHTVVGFQIVVGFRLYIPIRILPKILHPDAYSVWGGRQKIFLAKPVQSVCCWLTESLSLEWCLHRKL